MCWQLKSAIQAALSVEIATSEATEVHTASSVVRSGVKNVSASITA